MTEIYMECTIQYMHREGLVEDVERLMNEMDHCGIEGKVNYLKSKQVDEIN